MLDKKMQAEIDKVVNKALSKVDPAKVALQEVEKLRKQVETLQKELAKLRKEHEHGAQYTKVKTERNDSGLTVMDGRLKKLEQRVTQKFPIFENKIQQNDRGITSLTKWVETNADRNSKDFTKSANEIIAIENRLRALEKKK
ncbi:MAG: hypothetical protein AAGG72_05690 [Pseudomonadota bacterium]